MIELQKIMVVNDNFEGFCPPFIYDINKPEHIIMYALNNNINTCVLLSQAIAGLGQIIKDQEDRLTRIEEILGL